MNISYVLHTVYKHCCVVDMAYLLCGGRGLPGVKAQGSQSAVLPLAGQEVGYHPTATIQILQIHLHRNAKGLGRSLIQTYC